MVLFSQLLLVVFCKQTMVSCNKPTIAMSSTCGSKSS